MSYATGTADTRETLLDLFRAFAAGSGWTVNKFDTKNTGKILHLQKTGATMTLYACLRSLYYENLPGLLTNDFAGIVVSMSSGYDSALDVTNQPGAPVKLSNASQWYAARISGFNPVSKYWFYSSSTPVEFLAMVVMLPNLTFRHIIIGEFDKYDDTILKGCFFFGSEGLEDGADTLPFDYQRHLAPNYGTSYAMINADERDGWWCPEGYDDVGNSFGLLGGCINSGFMDEVLIANSLNEFSNASALVSSNMFIRAQTGMWAHAGFIPCLRFGKRTAYLVDTVYPLGTDDWMAFPLYNQSSQYAMVYKKEV